MLKCPHSNNKQITSNKTLLENSEFRSSALVKEVITNISAQHNLRHRWSRDVFVMYSLTALLVCLPLKSVVTILKEILEGSLSRLIRKWEWKTTTALEFCSWMSLFSSTRTFEIWRLSPLDWQLNLLGVPFWSSGFLIHVLIYYTGTVTDSLCSMVFSCFSSFSDGVLTIIW